MVERHVPNLLIGGLISRVLPVILVRVYTYDLRLRSRNYEFMEENDYIRSRKLVADMLAGDFSGLEVSADDSPLTRDLQKLGARLQESELYRETHDTGLELVLEKIFDVARGEFDIELDVDPYDDILAGVMTGIIMMAEELEALTAALEDARDEAVNANETKSQFLANMSHELRTPLNAIIGYAELVREDADDDGLDHITADVDKILVAGRHLLSLISDILNLSKIEAGKMEIYCEWFGLESFCQDLADTVEPLTRSRKNTFEFSIGKDLDAVRTDRTKLGQIILNLLSNANKFTDEGKVSLDVSRVVKEDTAYVRFEVVDEGTGISQERLEAIFQPFTQEDNSTTRRFGGTGLGLTISKHFSVMLGGDIEVKSVVGEGSTFRVYIKEDLEAPELKNNASELHKSRLLGSSGARVARVDRDSGASLKTVLIVDDDPNAHELIARFLPDEEFDIVSVYGGQEAIDFMRERVPDMVLLDIDMPEVDGWTVLAMMKRNVVLAEIPVVIVSVIDNYTVGFAMGASEYLVKPIDYNRLLDILLKLSTDGHFGTVLIADDDDDARAIARRAVQRVGYEISEARNGKEVIKCLETNPPDMILLDLMMPEMDGFEVLERMRANEAWRDIKVVVVTALNVGPKEFEYLGREGQKVLHKGSYTPRSIFQTVRSILDRSGGK